VKVKTGSNTLHSKKINNSNVFINYLEKKSKNSLFDLHLSLWNSLGRAYKPLSACPEVALWCTPSEASLRCLWGLAFIR
jgi:hypothetical protein